MPNILSVYNEKSKEIFQIRVNPVMTVGGLKSRIACHYRISSEDVIVFFNGTKYDSKPQLKNRNKKLKQISRTPSPTSFKISQIKSTTKLRPQ